MRMLTKAISLGSKRASRMRRSSGNDHGIENSTREHLVAAQKHNQKPQTFTRDIHDNRDTGKEVVTKITPPAGTRVSRRRNSDNTSIMKQIKAYPEDISVMTDKLGKRDWETRWLLADKHLEAGFVEELQTEGQNTIGEAQVHSGSTPGFGVDKFERAQDQPPVFPDLSLNQGAVAITMEKPIRASKLIQRKRAPKKDNLPVQPDARTGASEVADKDQGTGCPSYYFTLFLI